MIRRSTCAALLLSTTVAGLTVTSTARAGSGDPTAGPPAAPPPGEPPLIADRKELKRIVKSWEPGDPVPPGFHTEVRPRLGLVVAGSIVFGGLWLGSIAGAVASKDSGLYPAAVPLAGPFIAIGTYRAAHRDSLAAMLLATDGVLQLGGAAMLLAGVLATRPRLVPNEARTYLLPLPMRVGSGQGLGLAGSF